MVNRQHRRTHDNDAIRLTSLFWAYCFPVRVVGYLSVCVFVCLLTSLHGLAPTKIRRMSRHPSPSGSVAATRRGVKVKRELVRILSQMTYANALCLTGRHICYIRLQIDRNKQRDAMGIYCLLLHRAACKHEWHRNVFQIGVRVFVVAVECAVTTRLQATDVYSAVLVRVCMQMPTRDAPKRVVIKIGIYWFSRTKWFPHWQHLPLDNICDTYLTHQRRATDKKATRTRHTTARPVGRPLGAKP